MQREAGSIGTKSTSARVSARPRMMLAVLVIGAAFGAFAYRLAEHAWVEQAPVPTGSEDVPQLVHRFRETHHMWRIHIFRRGF